MKTRIDAELAALAWSESDSRRALQAMKGEIKVKKRMTFALALTLALLLLTATALGVTGALTNWLGSVETMLRDDTFFTWDLPAKTRFVAAMRAAELTMDEGDYAILSDETQPDDARAAAADRIIDARYGDAMRADAAGWVQPPDSVIGMAPDPNIIFHEAFFAAYPDASEQDCRDALERWYREMSARDPMVPEDAPVIDEQYVVGMVKSGMTEVLNWSAAAAEAAEITAVYHESEGIWEGVGRADKALADAGFEPITSEPYVKVVGDQYETRVLVSAGGELLSNSLTLAEYLEKVAGEPPALKWNHLIDECYQIAADKIAAVYGLSAAEIDALFPREGDVYRGKNGYALEAVLFKRHADYITTDWLYAVIVDTETGAAVDWFTPDGLWDEARLQKLAAAYADLTFDERLDYMRWYGMTYNPDEGYRGWSDARKTMFISLFKPVVAALRAADPTYADIVSEVIDGGV